MSSHSPLAERGTRTVAIVTALTMVLEIFAGWQFNSMALTADGWHMGTHAFALGLAAFAYAYARRHQADPRFTFGTFKVEVLGAYTSALFLLAVAATMIGESVSRLQSPLPISFDHAILVALIGLIVNLVCAIILHRSDDQASHHAHQHAHHDSGHHHHRDLNLRAAYLHVVADAATSVLAIIALLGGKWWGWNWLDPVMGIVGAVLIVVWARGLIKDTARVLLDAEMASPEAQQIRQALSGVALKKLQVWRIARNGVACRVVCLPAQALAVRQQLAPLAFIVQLSVEVSENTGAAETKAAD